MFILEIQAVCVIELSISKIRIDFQSAFVPIARCRSIATLKQVAPFILELKCILHNLANSLFLSR